jgi:hypothetical protein
LTAAKPNPLLPVAACMTHDPAELREKAEHFRRLAYGVTDEETRKALLNLAGEFDQQASEAAKLGAEERRTLSS